VGAELFHAQVTRAQGPFSLRQTIRVWGLDYLAENIAAPTVTLHYPSRRELVRELRRGDYTHVGINFVVATFHKVREMVPLIRRHAPGAQVVLGGYGTVLPDDVLGPWADAVCREEGIGFMRRLLGEPVDAPVRHPHAPIPSVQVLSYQLPAVVGHVTAGLGCSNGCDFCCTSHFFQQKYVRYLDTGRDVYDALLATRARATADGVNMDGFIIIDEDFFMHPRRAREFLDCVREGGESLSLMGFGSTRGLSRFSPREIAEMGFHLVWNAFEGADAGYRKQQGRPMAALYRDLQSVGCAQLTSMIIGFPYQDEARIWAEFDALMQLEPAMVQCLIYFAFPGTPFHREVIEQGRYLPRYREAPDLRRWDGFAMHFSHPHFDGPEAVEALQRAIYREDFSRLGPTPVRVARVWLTGYQNLRNDPNPLLAARAEKLRQAVRQIVPAVRAAMLFGPSREARARARALREDIIRATGELTAGERTLEQGAALFYAASRAARALGLLQQPGLLRLEHRTASGRETHATGRVMRLQGGARSALGQVLIEDLVEKLRRAALRLGLIRAAAAPAGAKAITTRATGLPRSLPVIPEGPACRPNAACARKVSQPSGAAA
jgi:hypothetical protein